MNRVASVLVFFLTLCSCGGDPSLQSTDALNTDEPSAVFRGCTSDDDCVAVPLASCCHNGWKTSVARSERDAYAHSAVDCPSARAVCPLYLIVDQRVPQCNAATHLCELVSPPQRTPASSN
jgi:hypothetical protein